MHFITKAFNFGKCSGISIVLPLCFSNVEWSCEPQVVHIYCMFWQQMYKTKDNAHDQGFHLDQSIVSTAAWTPVMTCQVIFFSHASAQLEVLFIKTCLTSCP